MVTFYTKEQFELDKKHYMKWLNKNLSYDNIESVFIMNIIRQVIAWVEHGKLK